MRILAFRLRLLLYLGAVLGIFSTLYPTRGQDWFRTGINLGAPRIRIAVSEFPPLSVDQALVNLTREFNDTLWNDLESAGIFEVVSKSYYPLKMPTEPEEVIFRNWSDPPVEAQMLVFGKTEVINANLVVTARLFDVKNTNNPSVLAKRYIGTMNRLSTREAAHRLANEIIQTLGGGVPGINLTRIAFVSNRTGHAEIWIMDYDGFNQHPVTSYGSYSTTPRWSPDNSRLMFTSYASGNPDVFLGDEPSHSLSALQGPNDNTSLVARREKDRLLLEHEW